MLRYKTETRPGLVALYNIWPGNGAGQFLQPQSPHGASIGVDKGCKRPIQNTGGNLHGYLVFFVPSLAHMVLPSFRYIKLVTINTTLFHWSTHSTTTGIRTRHETRQCHSLVFTFTFSYANSRRPCNTRLTAIFQDNTGKLVAECLHSGLNWS